MRWIIGAIASILAILYLYRFVNESSDLLSVVTGFVEPSFSFVLACAFGIVAIIFLGGPAFLAKIFGEQGNGIKRSGK